MNHRYQLRYLLPILAALAALATAQSLYLNPLPLQSGASSAGSDVPSTTGSVGFLSHAQAARLLAALSGASRGADPLVLASLDTTAARKEEPASSYLFAPHAPMHVVIEAVGLDDGADVTAAAPAFVLQEDDANESILAVPVAQTAAAHANAEFKPNNGESSSSSYDEIDVTSTADVDRVVALLAALAAHPEGIQEDGSNMGPRLAAIRVTGLDAARPEYKDQVASVRRILASVCVLFFTFFFFVGIVIDIEWVIFAGSGNPGRYHVAGGHPSDHRSHQVYASDVGRFLLGRWIECCGSGGGYLGRAVSDIRCGHWADWVHDCRGGVTHGRGGG
ncbi:hypothetical protein BC828DRAFT_384190 [Blastocladiella britannica]|nr:hypothetical protein BC828DRAFT_384190 [Blastocladiella britannica]